MCTFYCFLRKKRCSLLPVGAEFTHLAAHSSKRSNFFSAIILVCLGNTQKNKTARQIALLLVLLEWTFDSYWWIGPISSLTSSNVDTRRINSTTRTKNSAVLWWLLWYLVTLYNSNNFAVSVYVSKQSFPN